MSLCIPCRRRRRMIRVSCMRRTSVARHISSSLQRLSLPQLSFCSAPRFWRRLKAGFWTDRSNARAQTALNAAIGDGYHAEVGSTVLRVTSNGGLALKAQDVTLVENASSKRLVTTDSVFIELNPLALLSGRIAVSRLEAEGAMLDPSLVAAGQADRSDDDPRRRCCRADWSSFSTRSTASRN